MPFQSGDKLGPYEIVALIGTGGMGEVYRAHDPRLGRDVAIKVSTEQFTERFEREARAVAALNHPHICTLYDIGPNFLVMEYIEGQAPRAPLPVDQAVKYAAHVADALEAAHARGIIHRDIKPANVMITPRDEAKVLDFGLARFETRANEGVTEPMMTAAGSAIGKVAYMSPEQARGQTVDGRTDIWAPGVMLYEMVTGARPFQGATQASIFDAIMNRAPVTPRLLNADVPPELEQVILKATQKDRSLRYQTAGEMRADLRNLQSSVKTDVPSPQPVAKPTRPMGRYFALGGALVLAAAAVGFFLMRPAEKPAAERSEWQQLTNFTDAATDPAFSPDGRMLTFKRGGSWFMNRGQIYVKMLPNGQAVQLTHDDLPKMTPVFSPDGSRVAYSVRNGRSWDTWEAPVLAGGEPRSMMINAEGLEWIDPRHILFSESRTSPGMVVVVSEESRAGMRDVYVPTSPYGMAHFSALSPDRKRVLIVEMVAGWIPCRLAPFDGSSKGNQVGPVPGGCTAAAWSPDGKWMYFTADTGDGPHLWRQKSDGGTSERITSGPTTEEGIAMSPDGRSIVTSVGTEHSSVWIHDAKGDRQISSEGDAESPYFSPDGTRVFFMVRKRSPSAATVVSEGHAQYEGELWATDLNSGRMAPALPGVSMAGYAVSPDGKAVAYTTAEGEGNEGGLWYAPLDQHTPPRNLVPSGVVGVNGIGASGDIFYAGGQGRRSYRIAPDGSAPRLLGQEVFRRVSGGNAISPDGRWAIMARTAYPLSGGRPVAVCVQCFFAWSPDGKSAAITFRGMDNAEELSGIVPLRGGAMLPPLPAKGIQSVEDLKEVPGVQMVPFAYVSPGPAGSYAYTKHDSLRNLYRIPLP